MKRRGPGRRGTLLRALAALGILVAPPMRGEEEIPADSPGAAAPLLAGGGILPLGGLFAAASGQEAYVPDHPHLNFDVSVGPFFPIDGAEDFDVGATVDFKFQGEVVNHLFLGGEFAFAGHDVNDVDRLYFEGSLSRFYLLVPIEVDLPIAGYEDNPFSLRFGVAPGMQIVDPIVDSDVDDLALINGFDIDEEALVAFNLRARVGLRFPVGPHFGFIVEAAYDWAEGRGKTRITDLFAGTETTTRRYVDLSGVSVLFGMQLVF